MDIFLSYSSRDEKLACRIKKKLEARKKTCFLAPEGIQGGDTFNETIRRAIWEAREVFVLLTENALQSEWVTAELGAAWVLQKRIVPILYNCKPEQLPPRLADRQTRDLHELDDVIGEYEDRQRTGKALLHTYSTPLRSRYVLLDIDGTVLDPLGNLKEGLGTRFLHTVHMLTKKGYYFVFITGNDFRVQNERILVPITKQGLGNSVFCFSDGGSRAFEFNERKDQFLEVESYSTASLMREEQVKSITDVFTSLLHDTLAVPDNDTLLRPHILWHGRTLDYLDIRIFPLRPSFVDSANYQNFCKEIETCFRDPQIQNATFQLIRNYSGSLIIRAHGRNPESDVMRLQDMIHRRIMHKSEYRALSKPEAEIRGGSVVCQIALKPFNDDKKRDEFRHLVETRLHEKSPDEFSVLLGGNTTIDIQIRGVNKQKAIQYLISEKGLSSQEMIYFGNEFNRHGNDRPVAEMTEGERPTFIVNVGPRLASSNDPLCGSLIEDGNGPGGTLNFLSFLAHQTV